jgi:peptide/nickel transport system permease protein
MKLRSFILRRLFSSIFVLLGLSILIFTLTRLVPGDVARLALGPQAPQWAVDEYREKLHLNEPLPVQYWIWITNALRGDLGESVTSRRPVIDDFIQYFPATLELVFFSTIITISLSLIIGAYTGKKANGIADNAFRVLSYFGIAVPAFVWAIIGLFLFGFVWKLFPIFGQIDAGIIRPPVVTGMMLIDSVIVGNWTAFINHLQHIILPSAVLSIARIAQDSKLLRSGMVENLKKDYILAATSYGIPDQRIMLRYLLKPSLIPMVSVMGMEIATSIGGSFIIEKVFDWPGFGKYGMQAMLMKDVNPIVASVMLIGASCAFVNIIVDVIVAYLDPRIRVMERAT